MKLAAWLEAEQVTQADFGTRIGTSQAAVARYSNGIRIPRPRQMDAISRVTNGRVTAADFYDRPAAACLAPAAVPA